MAEQVLTQRELNRTMLSRQLLLERSSQRMVAALEKIGGLQTQYAPAGYIGLWSRLRDFKRDSLTRALEERRVVQATLMRATIHMVSAADYVVMEAGVRRCRREWWTRTARHQGIDMDAVAKEVRTLLRDGPMRQADLVKALEPEGGRMAWSGAGMWVDLVRIPPSGTWERRRADLYGLAEDWLDDYEEISEADGIERLVAAYLSGFGPAPLAAITNWAGLPKEPVKSVVAGMELRTFRDENGKVLLDLPRLKIEDGDTPAPVRFLPVWDATLLVHARRTLVLAEEYRPRIFNTKTPHSMNTFLVDGAVAGTWRFDKDHVEVDPFGKLPAKVRKEIDDEAERLAAFHVD
jgi:hypothetical protein